MNPAAAASAVTTSAELDLWRLASDSDPDVHAVSSTLATIPELATATIRFANSAYVGTAYPVGTVLQAVVRVGCRTVASLAAAATGKSIMASFGDENSWMRALIVSRGAKTIGRLAGLGHDAAEQAFVAGLFVDFGSTILAKRDAAYLNWRTGMMKNKVHGAGLLEREQELYGADHAMLAGQLLEEWNFPPVISTAVAMHHTPVSDLERVLAASMSILPDDDTTQACVDTNLDKALEAVDLPEHAEFVRREAALFADSAAAAFLR